jgi:Domain of unknown function (DUF5916)/Carbohydrate family 9 binding domain-like
MYIVSKISTALFLALSAAGASSTPAQQSPQRSETRRALHAVRATGSIRVDGVLDEPDWQRAIVAGGFTQSYPAPGAAPADSTLVRVLFDDNALYVGVRLFDSDPSKIAAQLARRDASGIYSDWVHVIIGTYHDRRTAFRFSVNPLGVERDVLEYDDNNEDENWDAVWTVGVKMDSLGWTAEYRIPFSQLRFPAKEPPTGRVWDIQIMRDIARRQERDSWAPWTVQSPGFVSSSGEMDGVNGIPAPSRLEVLPYASAQTTRAPRANGDPFFRASNAKLAVGGDAHYGLSNGLTLTASVNPDFGQVEVDPAVVNLSAFETFFPEKRPFFLEGADIFNFGATRTFGEYGSQHYFYSRRIGRQPQRSLNAAFVDAPQQTPILGALKLTGKTGPWTVGGLDAVTNEQSARFFNSPTDRGAEVVEPLTNYFMGRLRRDLNGGKSFIGGMVASTTRSVDDTAIAGQLRRQAVVSGLDFEHSWSSRQWIVTGFGVGSRVEGTPASIAITQRASSRYYQRPDAPYVRFDSTRSFLGGYMGELALQENGAAWSGSLDFKEASPGFEINDLGFQSKVDYRALDTEMNYRKTSPGRFLRNYDGWVGADHVANFGGVATYDGAGTGGDVQFSNLWQIGGFERITAPAYDERLTRGGPLLRMPALHESNFYVMSDSRWPVTATLSLDDIRDRSGSDLLTTSLALDWRPASYVHVSAGPALAQQFSTDQYVTTVPDPTATTTFGRRYVFSNLHQTTFSLDARIDWTFTPTLTLQMYAQPFVSAGRYDRLKEFARPRSYRFTFYGADGRSALSYDATQRLYTVDPDGPGPAAPFTVANPNFNIRSLHGNAVARWQYRPGSTLFFVWQQERSGFDPSLSEFEFRRDAGAVFRSQPTNVFLVKVAYWLGK